MAILFLLLLTSLTLVSADVNSTERHTLADDHREHNLVPADRPSPTVGIKHGERHWWHKQQAEHHSGRSRRWKEVPNGEEVGSDIHHQQVTMVDGIRTSLDNQSGQLEDNHVGDSGHSGIHVASWRWDEIGIYITFTTFIIVAGLAKVGKHHVYFVQPYIS